MGRSLRGDVGGFFFGSLKAPGVVKMVQICSGKRERVQNVVVPFNIYETLHLLIQDRITYYSTISELCGWPPSTRNL